MLCKADEQQSTLCKVFCDVLYIKTLATFSLNTTEWLAGIFHHFVPAFLFLNPEIA